MNAFHRIAGVQETSDSNAQPNSIPVAPPIPRSSTDDADARSLRRASLPLNRKPSHRSFRSHHSKRSIASQRGSQDTNLPSDYPPTPKIAQHNGEHAQATSQIAANRPVDENDDESEEFAWGPAHPCFPHPNPHCPENSEEFTSTRVIRIKRDWLAAGDLYPQFANLYPEILDPLVTEEEFRQLISTLNAILARVFSPYTTRAWIDSLLGAFSGYLWEDLGLTGAKKGEKEVETFIERWNSERRREGRDVKIVQGRITGYMSLDFVVPDPGIDVPIEDEDDEDEEQGLQDALQGGQAETNNSRTD